MNISVGRIEAEDYGTAIMVTSRTQDDDETRVYAYR